MHVLCMKGVQQVFDFCSLLEGIHSLMEDKWREQKSTEHLWQLDYCLRRRCCYWIVVHMSSRVEDASFEVNQHFMWWLHTAACKHYKWKAYRNKSMGVTQIITTDLCISHLHIWSSAGVTFLCMNSSLKGSKPFFLCESHCIPGPSVAIMEKQTQTFINILNDRFLYTTFNTAAKRSCFFGKENLQKLLTTFVCFLRTLVWQ